MPLMPIPALSNMPPGEPKAFCISTTITAVRAGSISTGAGVAWISMVCIAVPFSLFT